MSLAWPGLLSLLPAAVGTSEVFLTREQALKRAFPEAHSFLEMRHVLSKSEKKQLQKRLHRRLPERGYLAYLARDAQGNPIGLAIVTAEVGKTEPFFLLLAIDLEGAILDIELLEYREPRGDEIRRRSYLDRYEDVNMSNVRKKLNRIPVIPGATLSCNAVKRAVRKTLVLHALYVREGKGKTTAEKLEQRFEAGKAREVTPKPKPDKIGRASIGVPAMGDVARIELLTEVAPEAFEPALAALRRIEDDLSLFRPQSATCRANALAIAQSLDLSPWPMVAEILARAFVMAERTGGSFSPVPSQADPRAAFHLDGEILTRVGPGDLDPGGFGKGLAADVMAEILDASGLPWTLAGFRSSFCVRGDDGVVGVATSGSKLRGGHIRDPRTCACVVREHDAVATATSAFEAECLSTARFVTGT